MRSVRTLSYMMVCASVFVATSAMLMGKEPGTSDNPKDNVPKDIQRSALGESSFPKGSSGPGTRSDDLVGMKKEKPEPVTEQQLDQNVESTHASGAALAAQEVEEQGKYESQQQEQQSK